MLQNIVNSFSFTVLLWYVLLDMANTDCSCKAYKWACALKLRTTNCFECV